MKGQGPSSSGWSLEEERLMQVVTTSSAAAFSRGTAVTSQGGGGRKRPAFSFLPRSDLVGLAPGGTQLEAAMTGGLVDGARRDQLPGAESSRGTDHPQGKQERPVRCSLWILKTQYVL